MTASARGWWCGKINIHILYFSFSRSVLASLTNVFGKNEKKNKTSVYRLRHPRTSSYENAVWTYNKGTPRCTGKGFRRRWRLCSLILKSLHTTLATFIKDYRKYNFFLIHCVSTCQWWNLLHFCFSQVWEEFFKYFWYKRPMHRAWHVTQWNLRSIVWDRPGKVYMLSYVNLLLKRFVSLENRMFS